MNLGLVKEHTLYNLWSACHPALCPVRCAGSTLGWQLPSPSLVSKGGVSWRRQTDLLWLLACPQWDPWASWIQSTFWVYPLSAHRGYAMSLASCCQVKSSNKREAGDLAPGCVVCLVPRPSACHLIITCRLSWVQKLRAGILETHWPGLSQAHSQCLAFRLPPLPPHTHTHTHTINSSGCVVERRELEQLKLAWIEPGLGSLEVCEFRCNTGRQSYSLQSGMMELHRVVMWTQLTGFCSGPNIEQASRTEAALVSVRVWLLWGRGGPGKRSCGWYAYLQGDLPASHPALIHIRLGCH